MWNAIGNTSLPKNDWSRLATSHLTTDRYQQLAAQLQAKVSEVMAGGRYIMDRELPTPTAIDRSYNQPRNL